jgi:hypothetical protein
VKAIDIRMGKFRKLSQYLKKAQQLDNEKAEANKKCPVSYIP